MRHQYNSGGVVSSVSHIHTCRPIKVVRSHYCTAGCLIFSEPHISEFPHRQGCAFTSQYGRVCDLFRVAHVGVTAHGCALEREIKSFNSFSAQGPESSHMP